MYRGELYQASDKMSDLICQNYPMLLVTRRFNIPLSFGEKTIGEVCSESQVPVETFLCVVNFLSGAVSAPSPSLNLHHFILGLLQYLQNSHHYFLEFRLPYLRDQLRQAIQNAPQDVSFVINHFFDTYVQEVNRHMVHEEEVVFPYVRDMLLGKRKRRYNISLFIKEHNSIDSQLAELKNLLIKYYPGETTDLLSNVLFGLFSTEEDLSFHHRVEERLLVPAVLELEKKI